MPIADNIKSLILIQDKTIPVMIITPLSKIVITTVRDKVEIIVSASENRDVISPIFLQKMPLVV